MLPSDSSVARARRALLAAAQAQRLPAERLLVLVAAQRWLWRLAHSPRRAQFVLKGGQSLAALLPQAPRLSLGLDLLHRGDGDGDALRDAWREVARLPGEDDGLHFELERLAASRRPLGPRCVALALAVPVRLAELQAVLQVTVRVDDVVRPAPLEVAVPSWLEALPAAPVLCTTADSLVAEKLDALVQGAPAAPRYQDLFDLYALALGAAFDGNRLLAAIRATFEQRVTTLPAATPAIFSGRASVAPLRRAAWKAFVRQANSRLEARTLPQVTALLGDFVEPLFERLARRQGFAQAWAPGGPWQAAPA